AQAGTQISQVICRSAPLRNPACPYAGDVAAPDECRASGNIAGCMGEDLSGAAGAHHCRLRSRHELTLRKESLNGSVDIVSCAIITSLRGRSQTLLPNRDADC